MATEFHRYIQYTYFTFFKFKFVTQNLNSVVYEFITCFHRSNPKLNLELWILEFFVKLFDFAHAVVLPTKKPCLPSRAQVEETSL